MRRLVAAAAAGSLAVALSLFGAGPASAADTAEVYVVHGVPGLPVDVYVNGALTLDDFQPETVAGPLDLPAGNYEVAITAADAADASSPLLTASADLAGGNSYTLVAHLDASGSPTITPYGNDISTISAGKTRLVVRHDAAAPAVDVRAGGAVVLAGVTNPAEGVLNIPAGTVDADVVLAGTTTVVIGPASLDLAEGTATSCTRSVAPRTAPSPSSRSASRACTRLRAAFPPAPDRSRARCPPCARGDADHRRRRGRRRRAPAVRGRTR